MLGLLGALDPFKYKVNLGLIDQTNESKSVLSIGNATTTIENIGKLIIFNFFIYYFTLKSSIGVFAENADCKLLYSFLFMCI